MITRSDINKKQSNSILSNILGPIIAAVLAASMAVAGHYITMEKQLARIDSSVNTLNKTIEKVSDEQASFFKASYVPLMIKVEQQSAAIADLKAADVQMKEEMRLFHPIGNYRDAYRKR